MGVDLESTNTNGPAQTQVLPPKFYREFLSDLAKSRKPSPIGDLLPLERKPGILSMLAGKPHPATFPFTSLSVSIRSPDALDGSHATDITLTEEELTTSLQYGLTAGMPILIDWLTNLMKYVHGAGDNEGWRLSIGPGSQDCLYKALSALLNPGDPVLVEDPTYPGAISLFRSLRCLVSQVASDADGIIPASLEHILDHWPASKPKPKLLYTIPYGANPSGYTTSEERRIEVIKLSRKHNFIIIEDDPYFYLYFGAKPRPASYFSLERSLSGEMGRVLRLDSFSKVLASGFRFGWVTGPSALIDPIDVHTSTSTIHCSSLTQSLVYKVLSIWGIPGFLKHTEGVAEFYRVRRDILEACLRRHLTGLAEWTTPEAGMFYWVKLHLPASSDIDVLPDGERDEGDSMLLFKKKAGEKNILVLPGTCAFFDNRRSPYIRLAFGLLPEADVDEALKRLASAIREEWDAVNKTGSNHYKI